MVATTTSPRYKGAIVTLYETPPAGSVVICLDEMGPESAKSHPGSRLVRADPSGERRVRATQEIDYGRRGTGYVFDAFAPATGQAFTAPYAGRTTANWVDFLVLVEAWVDPAAERLYAILDNLSTHRAMDVLLWSLTHPRWEFVFQPTYAAYLNLIEPWWKILRSLALNWNAHRHPFVWDRRKRRRTPRTAGIGTVPAIA